MNNCSLQPLQAPRLGKTIDELLAASHRRRDLRPMRRKDGALGASRVILRQFADGREQRTAQRVVEILRRDRGRRAPQAVDQRGALRGRIAHEALENAVIAHEQAR